LLKVAQWVLLAATAMSLTACAGSGRGINSDTRANVSTFSPRIVGSGQTVHKGGGRYKLGKPYRVGGKLYVPRHDPDYSRTGVASWYGEDFHGRLTANGEVYDMHRLTAAHPTLPLPSLVLVTNTQNGKRVVVRVNDRGPFARNRIIDLSQRAANQLGIVNQGTGRVHVKYLRPAPL